MVPDGKMILFGNGATAEDLAKAAPKLRSHRRTPTPSDAKRPEERRETTLRVITRARLSL